MVSTRGSRGDGELSGSRKRRREDDPTRQTPVQSSGKRQQRQSSVERPYLECDALPLDPCPTWIFCSYYDFHVAKDKSWFADDYIPVRREYTTRKGDTGKGLGVGTVVLPVKRFPDEDGPSSNGLLVLENVTHAPDAPCNIIGRPITQDYRVTITYAPEEVGDSGTITDHQGRQIAFFKPEASTKFPELCLSKPPVGPRVVRSGPLERLDLMDVSFRDGDEWNDLQDSLKPSDVLTSEEKKYLLEEYTTADSLCEHYRKDPGISKEREEAFRLMRLEIDEEMHIAAYGEPPKPWRHPAATSFQRRFFRGHRLDPFNDGDQHITKFLVRLDPDENNLESWMDSPEAPALFKDYAEKVGKDFILRHYGGRRENGRNIKTE
ncbi:signal sequence receptor alpha subunit [Fusarium albosuccineum]|uniref:Signal sequence receptor alpha subunit n=1 Tax=Fusarium albosuccineum TaxID=1237068 RepID=A0A8H4LAD6_9HYPO|nr:signal sequence receptor alpha subunit [Fusarium albosuccineum]